ncbi:hypothetical protein ABI59_08700 [Acidobacteria bacterium Mor1]|nr:hypothetical protein ABI59_08700 [Acidobacteria bacterium Mor1]
MPSLAPLPGIEIKPPLVGLSGLPTTIEIAPSAKIDPPARFSLLGSDGAELGQGTLEGDGATSIEVELPAGRYDLDLRLDDPRTSEGSTASLRVIPAWLTILPPVIAILLALIFRQVIPALLVGVWSGTWLIYGDPFTGALRAAKYLVDAVADGDHASIIVFSLFLGGMVGVMSRSGGTTALVERFTPLATSTRRGQLATWLMGLAVFFDDYANTLVVGNTMRPVTDRLKVSREKLAYIVDSTAAPVAALFLVSTWIGFEVSLIGDALTAIGSDRAAYTVFLAAIPYNFYPLLALAFGFMIAATGRDFGPMRTAENRARGGQVLAPGAVPLADFEGGELEAIDGRPRHWSNAAIPVLLVVAVTFTSLWLTGRQSLIDAGDPLGTRSIFSLKLVDFGSVMGEGASYDSLLYAATAGLMVAILLALVRRSLTLSESMTAMIGGFKSMLMAFVILTLAWAISRVCSDLNTSQFMVSSLTDRLHPGLLPTLVFVLSAATAFATGSSWSTMGILIPVAVPTAFEVAKAAGYADGSAQGILLGSVASVLAGAIFGDHCSPISDTTVLSSMSSGCDHMDHVRTQLPYALTVGGVSIILGTLPAGFGFPAWAGLLISLGVLAAAIRLLGRPAAATG